MARGGSHRPNKERLIDIEGGNVPDARDLKSAAEVAASALDAATFARVRNELADLARDADTSLTRARRDRDRATPRDATEPVPVRLQQGSFSPEEYREGISPRQRKLRSIVKNEVMAEAPQSQLDAIKELVFTEDPTRWQEINEGLHTANGNVHALESDRDRKLVQRADRAIMAYERKNNREHRLYFSVELPADVDPVIDIDTVPATMQEGARVTLDQFTLAAHDPAELPGHRAEDPQYVIVELITNRGLYLGRSDSIADSTHLLPRGIDLEFGRSGRAPFTSGGELQDRVIIRARERKPIIEIDTPRNDSAGPTTEGM